MSTVLIDPACRPALDSICWIMVVVVVLPSVPVTPMTTIERVGCPKKALDIRARARRVSATTTWGQAVPIRRCTTATVAPSRSAVSTYRCPSVCSPGIATKQSPGRSRRES